jgi:fructokinase
MSMPTTILALGEVLWDVFPDGPRFGGAPANFACACAELGGTRVRSVLVSAVGDDELGTQARQRLADHGVETTHVASVSRPTGQVLVNLDSAGNASYRFIDDPAWDHLATTPQSLAIAKQADVIAFGTLGQRAVASRRAIRELLAASSPTCWRVLDINLRSPHWARETLVVSLTDANVLKLNDEELLMLATALGLSGGEAQVLQALLAQFSLRLIALTRGAHGSRLVLADGTTSAVGGRPIQVVDTVGAGDAFTAALVLGLTQGLPLDTLHHWASDVAAFVCTRSGGTPRFPNSLHASTNRLPSLDELATAPTKTAAVESTTSLDS